MRKTWIICVLLCLLAVPWITGCTAHSETEPEAEQEQTQSADEVEISAGITVDGTVVSAAGKKIDLSEKNEYVRDIVRCQWVERNKVAIQSRLAEGKGQDIYFTVYDVVRDMYIYEQYGKQFIWQNDDLDTLIYVVDYAGEQQPSRVYNRKDVLLYETGSQEEIQNIAYVPKGIKVEIGDLRHDNTRQVVVETAN